MSDGSYVAMDTFWKERIGRETNRVRHAIHSAAPGTRHKHPPLPFPGIAGTPLSHRFHCSPRVTEACEVIQNPMAALTMVSTPRTHRDRSHKHALYDADFHDLMSREIEEPPAGINFSQTGSSLGRRSRSSRASSRSRASTSRNRRPAGI
mmetsp:Transcript_92100/g.260705  ORF Transcript_92100/g.260705 Transcript_92100/m.260705 type:complete len:150 (+) Transcript_92100:61-510(+)